MSWEATKARTRNAIAAGQSLVRDPEIRAAAGGFMGDVLIKAVEIHPTTPRPSGERLVDRLKRVARTVFIATNHVTHTRLEAEITKIEQGR